LGNKKTSGGCASSHNKIKTFFDQYVLTNQQIHKLSILVLGPYALTNATDE